MKQSQTNDAPPYPLVSEARGVLVVDGAALRASIPRLREAAGHDDADIEDGFWLQRVREAPFLQDAIIVDMNHFPVSSADVMALGSGLKVLVDHECYILCIQ